MVAMRFLRAPNQAHRLRAIRKLYRWARCNDAPQTRGLRLLRTWLSPEQRAQFDALGYFDVIGGVSGRRYRIYPGVSANIHEIGEDGAPKMGWCFAPNGGLVPGDVMLAQKVALETSECAALAVANRFPAMPPRFGTRYVSAFLDRRSSPAASPGCPKATRSLF